MKVITIKEKLRPVTGLVRITGFHPEVEEILNAHPELASKPEQLEKFMLFDRKKQSNLVVSTTVNGFGFGRNWIRDLLAGITTAIPTHVAWGTNATTPTLTDAALYTEVLRTEIIARPVSDDLVTFSTVMGSVTGNGNTFREASLVSGLANTQARMLARIAFNDEPKNSSTVLVINWDINLS